MSFLHPSIFYLHFSTLFKVIWLNCFKHFSVKRFLITVIMVDLIMMSTVFVIIGRILDEILFPAYRKVEIKNPVFIISNPRSGTTFLHRLMCLDEDRFTYMLLYHTIIPSITWMKLVEHLGTLDRKIGRPMRKFFDWLDRLLFSGWKDMHPMGFNQPEEDENLFVNTWISPGVFLLCPFVKDLYHIPIMDEMPQKSVEKIMQYYESSLRRFVYATGKNKLFLSKNVLSTGRLKALLRRFPDARVVFLIRNPDQAVPSYISMFCAPWKFHSPKIEDNSKLIREMGQVVIDYYNYFQKAKSGINKGNLYVIRYDDLVSEPYESVVGIYKHFGMEMDEGFKNRLKAETSKSRKYKSKHGYTLQQYGYTPEKLRELMPGIYEDFHFK